MGRYIGPVERLSRREGVDLCLKGARRLARKGGIERRGPGAPGQHGTARPRRASVYGFQLREKQKAKRYYGVRERQFRRYFRIAVAQRELVVGEALLVILESRLDNVIYRLGLAATRAQARQFVGHRHVLVNGALCDVPSRRLREGDVVLVRPESAIAPIVRDATELVGRVPAWLEADHDRLAGRVLRLPARPEIDAPVHEQMIVELMRRG